MSDLESVEGVIDAALEERSRAMCSVDLDDELRGTWAVVSDNARATLERKARVRVEALQLTGEHLVQLNSFNDMLIEKLAACDDKPPTPDTDGMGTDTGDTDLATGSDTDDSTSTTGQQPCASNDDCTSNIEPYCNGSGFCTGCDEAPTPEDGDAACAAAGGDAPLCNEGTCVACTSADRSVCDALLQVCDDDTMECVPCSDHDECESGACDLLLPTPECFEPDNIFDAGLPLDTANQEYPTVTEAWNAASGLGRAVIRLNAAGSPFDEFITVDSGAIAFIVEGGANPLWTTTQQTPPMLSVTGADTRVYLDGINLSQSSSTLGPGFVCNDSTADIRRSQLVANISGGIIATNGCNLLIQTSMIGGNISDVHAIDIQDSNLSMVYATVGAGLGDVTALTCNAASTIDIRNSILVARDGSSEFDCELDFFENNATNTIDTGTNHAVGPFGSISDNNWFIDYITGNLQLNMEIATSGTANGATVFRDRASWKTGDPTTDIDGDLRPTVNRSMDYAGADIP